MTKKKLTSLDEFICDDSIKNVLHMAINAAKNKGEPLKHILLKGAGGLGKSTLAELIHNEYNPHGNFVTLYGPSVKNDGYIIKEIRRLQDGDVLLIDEVHRIKDAAIIEMLYSIIQDRVMHVRSDSGNMLHWPVKNFTIIAATTDIYMLTDSFIGRFPLQIELLPYSPEQLQRIIKSYCSRGIDDMACEKLGQLSHGVARVAVESVGVLELFADSKNISYITEQDVVDCFSMLSIDPHGLTRIQRDYIELLADNFTGGMSLGRISTALKKPTQEITRFIEPTLHELGFIEINTCGRCITQKGLDIVIEENKLQ